jgi:hypothetical protein
MDSLINLFEKIKSDLDSYTNIIGIHCKKLQRITKEAVNYNNPILPNFRLIIASKQQTA